MFTKINIEGKEAVDRVKYIRILFISILLLFIGCGDDDDSLVTPDENIPPIVETVTASDDSVNVNETITVVCKATDADEDGLTYSWSATGGTFPGSTDGASVTWQAPESSGSFTITVEVSDGEESATGEIIIYVAPLVANRVPVIESVTANPDTVITDGVVNLICTATDEDGDVLSYVWTATGGSFPVQNNTEQINWQAPETIGDYTISVTVSDGDETVDGSVDVYVMEPEEPAPEGMVLIPAKDATFQMGSDNGFGEEMPVHNVTFTYDFWMDITEVTQADYDEVMSSGYLEYLTPSWRDVYGLGDDYPAYELEWGDAALYCNSRSKRDGLDTVYTYSSINGTPGGLCELVDVVTDFSKNGYRLATEAEWEFACRANTTTDFYWNKDFDPYPENAADSTEIGDYAVWSGNSWSFGIDDEEYYGNHPVGSKAPNGYGLYDMTGNAFEWINDWYTDYTSEDQTDPRGGENTWHMVRGGCWGNDPIYLRSANRTYDAPGYYYGYVGFRVVREVR